MADEPVADDGGLGALLEHVKRTRGFDFSGYKRASLERRISRRVQEVGATGYADYLDRLEVEPAEFTALFNTILINVTSFFRDASTWEAIQAEVVPRLLERAPDGPIRLWSAGCSSGQEPYTMAMLLAEALGDEQYLERVKIYATDVDDEALAEARAAVYSAREVEGLSEERLSRFFVPVDGGFAFRKDLRRSVIFGRNDLVQDAPISRIDLLACRNLLMYFTAETQGAVLRRLHFALNPHAVLVLGKSEMLLRHPGLFTPLDLKRRVFSKTPGTASREERLLVAAQALEGRRSADRLPALAFLESDRPMLVLDPETRLVAVTRAARSLLGVRPGDVGRVLRDLEVSYRPLELRAPVARVLGDGGEELLAPVTVRVGEDDRTFRPRLWPLADEAELLGVAVVFDDITEELRLRVELETSSRELETAYEELQSTVEELETTNEELQSTNEELETTNEELQSTNEELETMNEELQSSNEELHTINEDVRERSTALDEIQAFMETVLSSLELAIAVLDRRHLVRVWNEHARELWGLRADEVEGRSFFGLDIGLPVDALRDAVRAGLEGAGRAEMILDAVNRRGRSVRCRTTVLPLPGADLPTGVVVVMEHLPPEDEGRGA